MAVRRASDVDEAGGGSRMLRSESVCELLRIEAKKLSRTRKRLKIALKRDTGDRRFFVYSWADVKAIAKHLGIPLAGVDTDVSLDSLDKRVRQLEAGYLDLVAQVERLHGLMGVPVLSTFRAREGMDLSQYPPLEEVDEMIRSAIQFVQRLPAAPDSPDAPDAQIVLTFRNTSEAFSYLSLVASRWYLELGNVAKRGWTIVHLIPRPHSRDDAGRLVEVMSRMLRTAPSSYKPKFVPEHLESQLLTREVALLPGVGMIEMQSTRKRRIPNEAILISPDSPEYDTLRAMLLSGIEQASDALTIYDWPGDQFCEAIADIEGLAGHRGLVMDGLSALTVPLDMQRQRLDSVADDPIALAKAEAIIAHYRRRESNFMTQIRQWECRDICSAQAVEEYAKVTGWHAKDDIFRPLGVRALASRERKQHLEHIIDMLSKRRYHRHYQLGLIFEDTVVDPRLYRTFWMFKSDQDAGLPDSAPSGAGCRVLLEAYETQSDGTPCEIDLEITDPWIARAFQERFEQLWLHTERRPSAVIRWLRSLIEQIDQAR